MKRKQAVVADTGKRQKGAATDRQRKHREAQAAAGPPGPAARTTTEAVAAAGHTEEEQEVVPGTPRECTHGRNGTQWTPRPRVLSVLALLVHATWEGGITGIVAPFACAGVQTRGRKEVLPSVKELSVTIGRLKGDLTDAEVTAVTRWLEKDADVQAYGAGFEAGDTAFHMHLQCVVRVYTTSAQKFKAALEKVLGWTRAEKVAGNVTGQVTTSVKVLESCMFAQTRHHCIFPDAEKQYAMYEPCYDMLVVWFT
jgi:hypothetical protein